MCHQCARPASLFCILPPYLLRSIALHGSQDQRSAALTTLAVDQTFRGMRAQSGLGAAPASPLDEGAKRRAVYSANEQQVLPGTLVRSEGDGPVEDVAVNEAYDGLGATFDLLWEQFGRHSIDAEGLPLTATVHFGQAYNNAFWNGEQMVFGDGDGQLFTRFTIAIDIIGHELAHGVIQDEVDWRWARRPCSSSSSPARQLWARLQIWGCSSAPTRPTRRRPQRRRRTPGPSATGSACRSWRRSGPPCNLLGHQEEGRGGLSPSRTPLLL